MLIKTLFRRVFGLGAACLLSAMPAAAGDQATLEVLGFSQDGRYFAFEQHGIQDGSGFPYSEIYVIDVHADSWVSPSPFRQRDKIDDSQGYDPVALLNKTRGENRLAAQSLLASTAIAGFGATVGSNPVTELSADPFNMTVNIRPVVPPIDGPMEIELAEFELPDATCASYGVQTKGFQLNTVYGGEARVRHFDKSLPKSRGCATGYRIERAVSFFPDGKPPVIAIIVHIAKHGFEGPDGRFLAITGRL
ncbi:putative secreted protein [Roseibium hamelinense]|uniref:Putative secreted protein n=1 Tax=Roseibium hamelinense TaxID=150831 RepID=A0A562T9X2_9HYPH|nr:DUF2259 domain-containing protein [Roseibium hamelinense]MTI45158.1 DUF2259 domain-containing protein [Roseibium hamelinense]TWI90481.1 putative secreted protein [Roseibium hamelinense]